MHRIATGASWALFSSALALAALSLGACGEVETARDGGRPADVPESGLRPTDNPCQHGASEYIDSSGQQIICGGHTEVEPWPEDPPWQPPPCDALPGGCFPEPDPEPPPPPDPGDGGGGETTVPDPTTGGCSQTFINAAKAACGGSSGHCANYGCGASRGIHSCADNGDGTNTYVCACACGPISRVGDTF